MPVIVQLSDTHLRADPEFVHERYGSPDNALAAAVDAVLAHGAGVDLVILTGDLADDGSVGALRRVRKQADRLGAPILAVAGNHDLQDSIDAVFGPSRPIDLGPWRIVPIVTLVEGREDGSVDVDAVVALLDDTPTLLVGHHPPASPSTHPVFTLEHGDTLLQRLAAFPDVRAIATGHLHEAFDVATGGPRVLGAPSTLNALQHDGPVFEHVADGRVGAAIIRLGHDGSVERELVNRR